MKYEVLGTDSHSYSIKMPTSRAGASRSASISDKMKAQMDERAEVLKARLQEKKRVVQRAAPQDLPLLLCQWFDRRPETR